MSTGVLTKLNFRSGIQKNVTEYQAEGSWVSADKVRFSNGVAEKIGGWIKPITNNGYEGVARQTHPWAALDGTKYIALGTHNSLWVYSGGEFYDITPIRSSVNGVSCFSGTSGSNVVNVSLNAHGAQSNDFVYINTSAGLEDGGHSVSAGLTKIVSAGINHFDISVASVATSSYTNEGDESVAFHFLLTAGLQDNGALFGWGSDGYGEGAWGEAGTGGVSKNLRQWSLANWGEDLISSPRNGGVYLWREVSGTDVRSSIINNAPTQNTLMFLSNPSRQLVVCGTSSESGDFDPLLVRWSDIEDYTTWTAAATNGAGDFRIQRGSRIVGAVPSKKEHLIFTDEGAYSMTFSGSPDYFEFDRLGSNCGAVGQNAAVDVNGVIYWMGNRSFFAYDGVIRVLQSSLDSAVFDQDSNIALNLEQKDKVYAGVNTEFSEVWWFYPSGDNKENSRYVIYNYASGDWYDGSLDRTTWVNTDTFNTPIATDATSTSAVFWEHESGYNDGNSPMGAFLISGEIQIEDGDQMMFVDQYVPDFEQTGALDVSFSFSKYPNAEKKVKGPFNVASNTDKVSFRGRGRSMNMKIESSVAGGYFKTGAQRIRVQPDGER